MKPACPSRKSYPGVAMMQSTQNRRGDDSSTSLDGASSWCVLGQSHTSYGWTGAHPRFAPNSFTTVSALSPTLAPLRLSRFFVKVVNSWEGDAANILTAIPLKFICQNKIASCDALPLGPDLRVTLQLCFGAKHRGQPSAFGSRSHALPQPRSLPDGTNGTTGQLVPSQAITARFQ